MRCRIRSAIRGFRGGFLGEESSLTASASVLSFSLLFILLLVAATLACSLHSIKSHPSLQGKEDDKKPDIPKDGLVEASPTGKKFNDLYELGNQVSTV